jgi:hypothetical protein
VSLAVIATVNPRTAHSRGTYDAPRHTYLDNVVVFTRLEAAREAGG